MKPVDSGPRVVFANEKQRPPAEEAAPGQKRDSDTIDRQDLIERYVRPIPWELKNGRCGKARWVTWKKRSFNGNVNQARQRGIFEICRIIWFNALLDAREWGTNIIGKVEGISAGDPADEEPGEEYNLGSYDRLVTQPLNHSCPPFVYTFDERYSPNL